MSSSDFAVQLSEPAHDALECAAPSFWLKMRPSSGMRTGARSIRLGATLLRVRISQPAAGTEIIDVPSTLRPIPGRWACESSRYAVELASRSAPRPGHSDRCSEITQSRYQAFRPSVLASLCVGGFAALLLSPACIFCEACLLYWR